MPSIGTYYSQNPTRCYVVTQDANNGEQGAYSFTQADVDAWVAANSSAISIQGKSLLIIAATNFVDVLEGNGSYTELEHNGPTIAVRKTLIDMGKEVVIGTPAEPRSFVLRYVKTPANSVTGADASFVYVVVENNVEDLQGDIGRFTVRVARI